MVFEKYLVIAAIGLLVVTAVSIAISPFLVPYDVAAAPISYILPWALGGISAGLITRNLKGAILTAGAMLLVSPAFYGTIDAGPFFATIYLFFMGNITAGTAIVLTAVGGAIGVAIIFVTVFSGSFITRPKIFKYEKIEPYSPDAKYEPWPTAGAEEAVEAEEELEEFPEVPPPPKEREEPE